MGNADDRFFALSVDLLCIAGLDGYFKRLNPAWERTLGYTIAELLSRPILEFIHPDDRQASHGVAPMLLGGGDVTGFENRYICKDGSQRWISWDCAPVREGDDCLYAIGRDVTLHRVAQETLKRKQLELEAVFRALPDLVFRTDAAGRLVDYSAALASDLYVAPEAFLGKTFQDVLPSEVGDALEGAMARAHRSDGVEAIEYRLAMPSGEQWFEARVVPFIEGQTITVVRNVTDHKLAQEALKRSEERLRESEKLEAIGRLAGGIAHDFNNLMMAVLTYGQILLRKLPEDDPRRPDVLEIRGAGERAARLTRQLLAFARRQILQPTVLDPGVVVRDMEGTLRGLIGEHIELTSSCASDLFSVRVDGSQLEQVVLNLVLNARDAMPAGGELRIGLENMEIDPAEARRLELPREGSYVRLSVSDTGCGIGPDVRTHLFEPFYTTKAPGEGTGLGLATVYGIVRQSGGSVAVQTAPGAGSSFSILLPRAAAEAEVPPPPPVDPPRGSETLLVVEDEAAVRRAIAETLRSLGYSVLEADSGAAALGVVEAHAGPIHLVLTDVVMPGVGGYELARRLRETNAEVVVLFMSGHAPRADASESPGTALLQKPFGLATLASRVREALDGASACR